MRVKILKRSFAGAEFAPDVRVLKVGGQSSAARIARVSGRLASATSSSLA